VTNEEIKELLRIFVDSGVAEMELKRGENSLRVRRNFSPGDAEVALPQGAQQQQTASPSYPASTAAAPQPQISGPPQPSSSDYIVKSPIVGTYYDAPKPGDPPFVKVGDQVEAEQVLCIIESMKLMNEIESDVAGTIVSKFMENGRPVEYGEALFAIRPR
jgi:acetyl-CoA carboxylase biotin carboxyl carrier protein